MGIPYSRQINAAFDQVTPLVRRGFQILETTKNIAILLAWVQVLTILLLALNFGALMALLVAMNPDLEKERQHFITPTLRILMHPGVFSALVIMAGISISAIPVGLYIATDRGKSKIEEVDDEEMEPIPEESEKEGKKESKKENKKEK